jgi:putative ABC transport system permease protein
MIWLVLMGRLKEGVTPGAAQAELQSIAANIAGNRDLTAAVYPLSRSKFWPSYRKDIRTSLSGFGIASGLILLLACANVSNLMLGRAMGRRREVAVRLAIGAGRGRIVRQLLTESAVLAALSCGAALAVAHELMQLLLRFPNALGLPLALDLHVESRALAFCIALSAITVVLFGLVPALHSARLTIVPSLKESGNAAAGGRHHWFRGGLVAVQAALSMILLVGGGLYGRTLWKAYSADLGFRGDHLLTAAFSLPPPGSDQAERMWSAQRTLIERLRATPGVISAALSSTGILSPGRPQARVGREAGPEPEFSADYEFVSGDFFKTMGIPLLEGRGFRAHGKESAAAAIVNRTLARRLSPRGSLVGQTLLVDAPRQPKSRVMVVGVAGDARYDSVWDRAEPRLYFPARQRDVSAGFVLVRTGAPPADLAEPLGKLWGELAPESPLYEIQTAGERLNLFLTPQRVAAGILGAFAALALVLTAVGLYSVVAFSVAQQKREIGIRVAIGAQPREVFAGVLRRSMIPALAGLAAGAAASLPLMRILAAKAREVSPYDVPTYLAVAAVLAMVACAAAVVPARRAMRVDPAAALRAE